MGGVTNLGRHLTEDGTSGSGAPVAVLCDEAESGYVRRRLGRAGLGSRDGTGAGTTGCFVCTADLEDELIRALGPAAAARVLAREGDLAAFRALRRQPAWRSAPVEQQLRRFVGAGSGRKLRYARLLTAALEPAALPPPLRDLLGHVPAG